jgi:very-short-patch-repair endonuclease
LNPQKHIYNLHLGAKPSTHQNAKELRRKTTEAEQKLWALLRNRQLKGRKFRRQHAIANYIVDFYCHECKLAVELDGYHHKNDDVKEYDKARTALLNEYGITVLRFWNEEIIEETEAVLEKIALHL